MSDELNKMFSKIAVNYDKVNRMISLGADTRWRRSAAKECVFKRGEIRVLDVATGTAELAIAIADEGKKQGADIKIKGVDFNNDMLNIARDKVTKKNLSNISFVLGDALGMELQSNYFDVVTTGFALRNFDDLAKFVGEAFRVLKPGGRAVFLDVSRPDSIMSKIFKFYYFNVIPVIGSRYNKNAYVYLISSLWEFNRHRLAQIMRETGFSDVKIKNLTFGAAYLLTATKPTAQKAK